MATYEVDTEVIEARIQDMVDILNEVTNSKQYFTQLSTEFQPTFMQSWVNKNYYFSELSADAESIEQLIQQYIEWMNEALTALINGDLERAEQYSGDENYATPETTAGGGGSGVSAGGGGGGGVSSVPQLQQLESPGLSYTPNSTTSSIPSSGYESLNNRGTSAGTTAGGTTYTPYTGIDYPTSNGINSNSNYGNTTSGNNGYTSTTYDDGNPRTTYTSDRGGGGGSSYSSTTPSTSYGGLGADPYSSYGSGIGSSLVDGYGSTGGYGSGYDSGYGSGLAGDGSGLGTSVSDLGLDGKSASLLGLAGGTGLAIGTGINGTGSAAKQNATGFGKKTSGITNALAGTGIALGLAGIGGGLLLGSKSKYYTFDNDDWVSLSEDDRYNLINEFVEIGMQEGEIETLTGATFKIKASELDETAEKIENIFIESPTIEKNIQTDYLINPIDENGKVDRYVLFIIMIIDGKKIDGQSNLYTIINNYSDDDINFTYSGLHMEDYIVDVEEDGEEDLSTEIDEAYA